MSVTVGSLFSGIGGLDLGLEWAGMRVIWQSEIDPYASRVLAKHWPHVPNLGDVTTIDWSSVERPDVICGGYPCQPFSLAGVRRGESDPRHLWPHFHRAIRELRPRYALLENVPGHLSLGFDRVLGDLAEIGYDTEWCSIPAAAVGAPHLRWRIFAVAYPHGGRLKVIPQLDGEPVEPGQGSFGDHADRLRDEVADTSRFDGARPLGGRDRSRRSQVTARDRRAGAFMADPDGPARRAARRAGEAIPRSEAIERSRRRGCSERHPWAVEPDVGRVAHGVPARVDRLRCLGNAVVPQVAEWIGRRLIEAATGDTATNRGSAR